MQQGLVLKKDLSLVSKGNFINRRAKLFEKKKDKAINIKKINKLTTIEGKGNIFPEE